MGFWDHFRPKPKDTTSTGLPEPGLGGDLYELPDEKSRRAELVRRHLDEQRRSGRKPYVCDGVDTWMADE